MRVGAALLRSRLRRCDKEGLPAYLESSKLENVPLYQHFGFHVTGALGLPEGAQAVAMAGSQGMPRIASVSASVRRGHCRPGFESFA